MERLIDRFDRKIKAVRRHCGKSIDNKLSKEISDAYIPRDFYNSYHPRKSYNIPHPNKVYT
jgi:hypothetical protein